MRNLPESRHRHAPKLRETSKTTASMRSATARERTRHTALLHAPGKWDQTIYHHTHPGARKANALRTTVRHPRPRPLTHPRAPGLPTGPAPLPPLSVSPGYGLALVCDPAPSVRRRLAPPRQPELSGCEGPGGPDVGAGAGELGSGSGLALGVGFTVGVVRGGWEGVEGRLPPGRAGGAPAGRERDGPACEGPGTSPDAGSGCGSAERCDGVRSCAGAPACPSVPCLPSVRPVIRRGLSVRLSTAPPSGAGPPSCRAAEPEGLGGSASRTLMQPLSDAARAEAAATAAASRVKAGPVRGEAIGRTDGTSGSGGAETAEMNALPNSRRRPEDTRRTHRIRRVFP